MEPMKTAGANWASDFEQYIKAMTWGHGYGGEAFWREEEDALLKAFSHAPVERCASIGCGLFRELGTLKKITKEEVIGFEYKQEFIDYLKLRTAHDIAPRVSLYQGDICRADMQANEQFDLVMVLFNTLGVVDNIPQALSNIAQFVAPGGILWISVWKEDDAITSERLAFYTSSDNKQAETIPSDLPGCKKIIVKKEDEIVFHSTIFSLFYLQTALQQMIHGTLEIQEFNYSRVFIMKKT